MKSKTILQRALGIGAAATLAACASAPQPNPILDEARTAYDRAAAEPMIVRSAPVELQSAQRALQQAQAAHEAGDAASVEHYAYLSKRRVETALESGKIAAADAAVADAGEQRQRLLVELRTREAEAQRQRAQASLADAEAARKAAEEQRRQADEQRQQAEAARAAAEMARKQAEERLAQVQTARSAAQAADERARKLASQLEELKTTKTDRGMVLTLGDVLFDFGRAELKSGAKRSLNQLASFLKEYPERHVVIEGHTDAVGSEKFNQMLSERRAISVRNALMDFGVSPKRITTRGFGPTRPIVSNDTPEGRQQNRRVEIVLPDQSG